MFNLQHLCAESVEFYRVKRAMADQKLGRCMGKHVRPRIERARAKLAAAGKTPYMPS